MLARKEAIRGNFLSLQEKDSVLREKAEIANEINLDFLLGTYEFLPKMVKARIGTGVADNYVRGRPEDEMLEIDEIAENFEIDIIEKSAKNYGVSVEVFSEHNKYLIGPGNPDFRIALDPFDNSHEYKQGGRRKYGGLNVTPHFVIGIYDLDNNPLCAGDGDLVYKTFVINYDGHNYYYDPTAKKTIPIEMPPQITTIKDPQFELATYDGDYDYSSQFNKYLHKLLKEKGGKVHGKAGAHIYRYLATGAANAYAIFKEPRGEIDPGLPIALSAGYTASSVNPDGTFEKYEFDPKLYYESVPFFVVASTNELRDMIISYYVKGVPLSEKIIFIAKKKAKNVASTIFDRKAA